jgi:hypothetical protein
VASVDVIRGIKFSNRAFANRRALAPSNSSPGRVRTAEAAESSLYGSEENSSVVLIVCGRHQLAMGFTGLLVSRSSTWEGRHPKSASVCATCARMACESLFTLVATKTVHAAFTSAASADMS